MKPGPDSAGRGAPPPDPSGRKLAGAAVVAVGTELFGPGRVDRNTPLLKARLGGLGLPAVFAAVVPDDEETVAETLLLALRRCRFVLVCGGLGPTTDDRTRSAAARALGRPLVEHEPSLEAIRARFRRRGIPMPEVNRSQALLPAGAEALPNAAGTAPGVFARTDEGAGLVLLPGPPRELEVMFDTEVRPRIEAEVGAGDGAASAVLGVAGLPESVLQERILGLTPAREAPEEISILPSGGEIEVRVTSSPERSAEVSGLADALAARLGAAVFTRTPGERLEHAVGRLLRARGERAAIAESLTGGLIAERITRVAGSSAYFDLALVTYANDAKRDLLGVGEALLRSRGAVSEPVAAAMAEGVRRRSGNTWGVSVTGIAGPGGGSPEKPVGLVWIAVSGPVSRTQRFVFPGDRDLVRQLAATAALDLLRRGLRDAPR